MADITITETPGGRIARLAGARGTAEVHEHGAHVTSWVPDDGHGEALFMSRLARIDGRSAIRGGVPVIFPQFGPGPMVKHGFARTMRWALAAGEAQGGVPSLRLALRDGEATRALWPHAFEATVQVALDDGLAMAMTVTNRGDAPFTFTGALHAYFRVADVERVAVHGLAGARVLDQLTRAESREGADGVRIAGPVDRIYADVAAPLALHDEATGRRLRLTMTGFTDAVVWNPAPEGARAIDDLGDEEWRQMLCIEPAVAARPVEVAPGATWTGTMHVTAGG